MDINGAHRARQCWDEKELFPLVFCARVLFAAIYPALRSVKLRSHSFLHWQEYLAVYTFFQTHLEYVRERKLLISLSSRTRHKTIPFQASKNNGNTGILEAACEFQLNVISRSLDMSVQYRTRNSASMHGLYAHVCLPAARKSLQPCMRDCAKVLFIDALEQLPDKFKYFQYKRASHGQGR